MSAVLRASLVCEVIGEDAKGKFQRLQKMYGMLRIVNKGTGRLRKAEGES